MNKKSITLLLLAMALIVLLLIVISCNFDSSLFDLELGITYENNIKPNDNPGGKDPDTDEWLRKHCYYLNILYAGETYELDVNSLSDTPIQVWGQVWDQVQDIPQFFDRFKVDAMTSKTVTWTPDITGKMTIWIGALQDELPAKYSVCVVKVEEH